jgi:hypothetical protein
LGVVVAPAPWMVAIIALNCLVVSMTVPVRAGREAEAGGGVVMAGDGGRERGSGVYAA